MASEREREQLVEDILNEALKGYDGLVPRQVLQFIRDLQGIELMCHPDARELVRQALEDAEVDRSGEVANEPSVAGDQDAKAGAKSG